MEKPQHPHSSEKVHNVLFDLYFSNTISGILNPSFKFFDKEWLHASHQRKIPTHLSVLTLKDIPDYIGVQPYDHLKGWEIRKVRQYNGFAADLRKYSSIGAYLSDQFSAKSRSALRGKIRKFERECHPNTLFYFGDISTQEYLRYMEGFFGMLCKRFEQKRVYNRNLQYWQDYCRVFKELILRKEACLMVILDGEKAISYSIAFCRKEIMFGYLQSFDPAYSRFNIGDIAMYKKLERSIQLGMCWYDFSKGENAFKRKWCNTAYQMNYWVCYRSASVVARLKAWKEIELLRLRQKMRDLGIIGKWFNSDRVLYKFKKNNPEDYAWKEECKEYYRLHTDNKHQ